MNGSILPWLLVAVVIIVVLTTVSGGGSNNLSSDPNITIDDSGSTTTVVTSCGELPPWNGRHSPPPCMVTGTVKPYGWPLNTAVSGTITGGYGQVRGPGGDDYFALQLTVNISGLTSDVTSLSLVRGVNGIIYEYLTPLSAVKQSFTEQGQTWSSSCTMRESTSGQTLRDYLASGNLYVLCKTKFYPQGEVITQLISNVTDQCGR